MRTSGRQPGWALLALVFSATAGCDLNPQPDAPAIPEGTQSGTSSGGSAGGAAEPTSNAGQPNNMPPVGAGGSALGGAGAPTMGSAGFTSTPTGAGGAATSVGGGGAGPIFGSGGSANGAGGSPPVAGDAGGPISTPDGGPPDTGDARPDSDTDGGVCEVETHSTLPGVTVKFPAQPCVFTLAEAQAGLDLSYEVVVAETVRGVVPKPLDAGQCNQPDESGLSFFERVSGGNESYCLCDQGLCLWSPTPTTLSAGIYSRTFTWDGTNWDGPSDTGNPKGPPFPSGTYTLGVRSEGTQWRSGRWQNYEVVGTLQITLTE